MIHTADFDEADALPAGALLVWHVLMVRARAEFAVESGLVAAGLVGYCPRRRYHREAQHKGARRVPACDVETALFPGYLFVGRAPERVDWLERIAGEAGGPDKRALRGRCLAIGDDVSDLVPSGQGRARGRDWRDDVRGVLSGPDGALVVPFQRPLCGDAFGSIAELQAAEDMGLFDKTVTQQRPVVEFGLGEKVLVSGPFDVSIQGVVSRIAAGAGDVIVETGAGRLRVGVDRVSKLA